MRFERIAKPLPRRFTRHPHAKGLVFEADISPHANGRIKAKLLVFKSERALRRFWRRGMGHDLGPGCPGVVNGMSHERMSVDEDGSTHDRRYCGDARYFCIIGLGLPDGATAEVVNHEAVHAAYCYEKRVRRNMFGKAAADYDEERIAYPSGRLAQAMAWHLKRHGL
jgi:hypothetical protein